MKRALLIGLNYTNSDYELQFCKADVDAVGKRMELCKVQTQYVYEDIGIQDLLNLLDSYKASQKKTDTFYFVYSGHGTQIPGNEPDQYDEAICLWKNGYIDLFRDDRLRAKLNEFIGQIVVIFDSCFSGGMDRNLTMGTKRFVEYDRIVTNPSNPSVFPTVVPSLPEQVESNKTDYNKPRINFMFASSEDEVSWESNGHGFFTGSLIKNWDSGKKYITQLMSLIYKDVQADQHPVHIKENTTGIKKLF